MTDREVIEGVKRILSNLAGSYRKQGKTGETVLCEHIMDYIRRSENEDKGIQQDDR